MGCWLVGPAATGGAVFTGGVSWDKKRLGCAWLSTMVAVCVSWSTIPGRLSTVYSTRAVAAVARTRPMVAKRSHSKMVASGLLMATWITMGCQYDVE